MGKMHLCHFGQCQKIFNELENKHEITLTTLSLLILTLTDKVLAYGDFIYNVKYYD